jgi:outer membrane protein OmpA-like peptidoglycan-associated protein
MKSTITVLGGVAGLAVAASLFACAATAPHELTEARAAYMQAADGPAKDYAPDDLLVAKQALEVAEQAFNDKGAGMVTKDKAYVAKRKAEKATLIAERLREQERVGEAEKAQLAVGKQAAGKLGQTRDQLAEQSTALSEARTEADSERAKRMQAEVEAKRATDALKKWAQVIEDERGLVITLSSGILFETNKSELRAASLERLDEVAQLLNQSPERKVRVEGFTDSRGSDSANRNLSVARAEAVRAHLVSRSVEPSRISAVGFGEERPVASNDSVEGRANNRRVEIVLTPLVIQGE